jgi:hypothetical protein
MSSVVEGVGYFLWMKQNNFVKNNFSPSLELIDSFKLLNKASFEIKMTVLCGSFHYCYWLLMSKQCMVFEEVTC